MIQDELLLQKLRPLIAFVRLLERRVPAENAKFWHKESEIGEIQSLDCISHYYIITDELEQNGLAELANWLASSFLLCHKLHFERKISFWQFRETFLFLVNECVVQYAKNPLVRPAFLQEGANDLDIWKEFSELQRNYQMGKFDYLLNAMQIRAAMQCPKCLKEVINTKIEIAKHKEGKSEQEIRAIELAAIPIIVATFKNCM